MLCTMKITHLDNLPLKMTWFTRLICCDVYIVIGSDLKSSSFRITNSIVMQIEYRNELDVEGIHGSYISCISGYHIRQVKCT